MKRKPLSVPHSLCGTQNSAGLSPRFHYVRLPPPSLSLPPFSLPNPIPILFPLLSLFSLPSLLSLLSPFLSPESHPYFISSPFSLFPSISLVSPFPPSSGYSAPLSLSLSPSLPLLSSPHPFFLFTSLPP